MKKLFYLFLIMVMVTGAFWGRVVSAEESSSPSTGLIVSADDAKIQYFGRWDHSTPGVVRTGRGATYIKANFTGTSIKVRLQDKENLWQYSIDGGDVKKFRPQGAETVLADALPAGNHSLLLVRRTEGYMGISSFGGFELAAGEQLNDPDPVADRRMEFVGDSITAGAINEGKGSYANMENGYMAFGPQLARMLNADWSIVAKSGEGLIHNYAEPWPGTQVHTKDQYLRTFYTDEQPAWDPATFAPQAIVIAGGTNDFSDNNHRPTRNEFEKGYTELINTVRAKNPDAVIICVEPVPSWVGADSRQWISEVVKTLGVTDKKLYFVPINADKPLLAEQEFVGDSTHPTVKGHTKVAAYLKDKVAGIMGW